MIFSKNVNFNLLVLQCVKVGDQCIISEGLTPTTSAVSENAVCIGAVRLFLVKCYDNKMVKSPFS